MKITKAKGVVLERFEFEFIKSMIIKNDDAEFENVSVIYDNIKSRFGFGVFDMYEIFSKCPQLCTASNTSVLENLNGLENICCLSSRQMRYFILKLPFTLLINYELVKYKIDILSVLLALPRADIVDRITVYPDLLFISKAEIKKQTAMLSEQLDEFGEGVRRILRIHPNLLFTSRAHIKALKKIMIYDFTISNKESGIIFKTCPTLLFKSESQLKDIYKFFYPRYFVKRDMKELFPACPQFLMLPPKIFVEKFAKIQNALNATEKETLYFIRTCPNIMFFENPYQKIIGFKRLNINMEFLKVFPKVSLRQEFTMPLKFIFARILGLESEFERLCETNTRTLLSRFLFMQAKQLYSHEDLILSECEFVKKYNIATKVLKICYPITSSVIKQISAYYVNLKESLPKWTDIVFPEFNDVEKFAHEKYKTNYEIPNFTSLREKYNTSKREFEIVSILHSLYLGIDECIYLIRMCPMLSNCNPRNIIKVINFLRRFDYSLEEVINLLLKKPSIFAYFVDDFVSLFNETLKMYNCPIKNVVDYIC